MNVILRPVDENNFRQVIALDVGPDQQNFVAPNVKSIAQSKIFPSLIPQAIYADGELVGFALYGRDPRSAEHWIERLMIDAAHQRKGYGRAAMHALIERLAEMPECTKIYLSFEPNNVNAERLYRSLGFEPTGETDEIGEIIMRYEIRSEGARAGELADVS